MCSGAWRRQASRMISLLDYAARAFAPPGVTPSGAAGQPLTGASAPRGLVSEAQRPWPQQTASSGRAAASAPGICRPQGLTHQPAPAKRHVALSLPGTGPVPAATTAAALTDSSAGRPGNGRLGKAAVRPPRQFQRRLSPSASRQARYPPSSLRPPPPCWRRQPRPRQMVEQRSQTDAPPAEASAAAAGPPSHQPQPPQQACCAADQLRALGIDVDKYLVLDSPAGEAVELGH